MNSNEERYSSGELEAYVLGLLPEEQAKAIEEAVAKNPDLKRELSAIETDLLNYAKAHAVVPPKSLKSKVISRLEAEGYRSVASSGKTDESTTRIISINKSRVYLYAASIALFISIGLNTYQYNKNNELLDDLYDVTLSYEKLQQDQQKWVNTASDLESTLKTLVQGSTRSIELEAQEGFASMQARVYWDVKSGKTILAPQNMPSLTQEQTYQLWMLRDGKPESLGIFDTEKAFIVEADEDVFTADAFAISIEPKGGSQQPTMDKICMVGLVTG